mgnify:CR=1 FL=1
MTNNIQPRVYRVLFPHGNYVINENTGKQTVPMVDMGLMKINDGSEPTMKKWAKVVSPSDFEDRFTRNMNAGVIKNFVEFEKTVFRAANQPELIWFKQETIAMWEGAE